MIAHGLRYGDENQPTRLQNTLNFTNCSYCIRDVFEGLIENNRIKGIIGQTAIPGISDDVSLCSRIGIKSDIFGSKIPCVWLIPAANVENLGCGNKPYARYFTPLFLSVFG